MVEQKGFEPPALLRRFIAILSADLATNLPED